MSNKEKLAFKKTNYVLMLTGIGLLILGFYIMTIDKEEYGFGALGLTIGPILVVLGFVIEFFAILHKSKK